MSGGQGGLGAGLWGPPGVIVTMLVLGCGGAPAPSTPKPAMGRLAAGAGHTCVIDGAGVTRCWGSNVDGQLGDGSEADSLSPRVVALPVDARALAAGSYHACALAAGASVACWGWNANGQIGDGSRQNQRQPFTLDGLAQVEAIAAGSYHSCAVVRDGAVRC